jgi:hypothetical protein
MASTPPVATPRTPSLPFPLQEGESIIEICRRHWIFFWPLVVGQLLAAVVPVVVLAILLNAAGGLDGGVAKVFVVLSLVYVAYWLVRVGLTWFRYRNDIWVITNQRLIDSYRRHPWDLSISTADLVNVQDMSVERNGVIRTLLDFGDIICQTASIDQDFKITGVPDPRSTQALVDRERDRERLRIRGNPI